MMNPKAASPSRSHGTTNPAPIQKSKRPKYSKFTQQELPACKPILTPAWVITTLASIAVVFIPIGLACLSASEHVVEIVDRYDMDCIPDHNKIAYIRNSETNKSCYRTLTVPKLMKAPVFVYYQLDKFYQNHRRYVKSRNDKQLRMKAAERQTGPGCNPEGTTSNGPIVPCGLIAWSLFNDTYKFSLKSRVLKVSKKNIAWKSDQEHKFGSDVYPKNFQSEGLIGGAKLNNNTPLSEQADLIVWMRTAVLPTFRKLYGKIEEDLQPNSVLTVEIQNNYNTYSFGGKKILVLSTASWLGGKNDFIGVAYLTFGGLSLFVALGFVLMYLFRPRTLGDPAYLSWNRDRDRDTGMGYVLLSWVLVEWIATSPISAKNKVGPEDKMVGKWLSKGGRGMNRHSVKSRMYDYPGSNGRCSHELIPDTVAVHRLKRWEQWLNVIRFFNVTSEDSINPNVS